MEMKRFLGNIARVFLATGALSVSAFAGADDNNTSGCTVAATGCESCCCGQPCCQPPVCGWAYNPPGYCRCNNPPTCDNCWSDGLSARVDFLWWRADVTNADFGVEETTEVVSNNGLSGTSDRLTFLNNEHRKQMNFSYDPGFRLGLYNACSAGCWDIGLVWTHFHTKTTANGYSDHSGLSETDLAGVDTNFFPFWDRVSHINSPDTATGRYAINLDSLDLEFGRKFYVSNCFVLRPHFGLRGIRLNQGYRIEATRHTSSFDNFVEAGDNLGDAYTVYGHMRNNFLAIGPRLGLEAQIHLGCGFSLFGEGAASLVFGRFSRQSKTSYHDAFTPTTAASFVNDYEYQTGGNLQRSSRATTDLSIGVKWERCFDWCNRLHPVGIAFAWEHHAFFGVNNFDLIANGYHPNDVGVDDIGTALSQDLRAGKYQTIGDIYTQGLTVTATFGF